VGEKFDTPSGVAPAASGAAMPASSSGAAAGVTPASAGGLATQVPQGGTSPGGRTRAMGKDGKPIAPPAPFNPKSKPIRARDNQSMFGKRIRDGKLDPETKVWFEEDGVWAETPDGQRGFWGGSDSDPWIDEQGNHMPADWKGQFGNPSAARPSVERPGGA
jgi:hypothetical protein